MISFLAGAAAGAFVSREYFFPMVALFAGAFFPVRRFYSGGGFYPGGRVKVFVMCGLAFLAGVFRFLMTVPDFGTGDIGFYRDMAVKLPIEGKVAAEPDIRSDFIYVVLETEKILYDSRLIPVKGNLLLKLPRYPQYYFGDCLKVSGLLRSPPVLEGYSYGDKLAKDGIYAVMYGARVDLLNRVDSLNGWSALFDLKAFINSRINGMLGEPAAGVVAGVLLGLRRSISPEIMDDFNRTGLTHILAISGYNITLLISVFGIFLRKAARRTRFFASAAGIIIFVLLTGMSASVIRAAVMGGLVLLSLFCGRKSAGVRALILSAVLMTLVNPRILLYDMSFQLSFLATLGILLFVPVLEERVTVLKNMPAWIGEGLGVTLAAQVFTTPLILYSFGRVSLISPLTNIVFLPLIPLIMFFSFFALISSLLYLPVTPVLAGITWLLCAVLVNGVGAAANLSLASVTITNFPLWMMMGCFAAAAAAWFILSRKPRLDRCS